MDYLTNYYKNLSEQLQEKILELEKFLNEMARPTFIPLTTAYNDAGDPPPNIATMRDDQEGDLRVDNFGGRYPNREYARIDRNLSRQNRAIEDLYREMSTRKSDAEKAYLSGTNYRGRPLSSYKFGSAARQNAMKQFNQSYVDPQDLKDQARGLVVLRDLTRKELNARPEHNQFVEDENLRADIIMGRRDSKGRPRNPNAPFGHYSGS